jgi:hypothetical protein
MPAARAAAAHKARRRFGDREPAIVPLELSTSSMRPRRSSLGGIEEQKEALARLTTMRPSSSEVASMAVTAETPNAALPLLARLRKRLEVIKEGATVH